MDSVARRRGAEIMDETCKKRNTTVIETSEPPTTAVTADPTPREITGDVLHILDEFALMVPQASITVAGYARGSVQF